MKILKTMFALGIVAGLAVISAKACDGPVLVPGYTAGNCTPVNYSETSGAGACTPSSGVIGHRDDYTSCGGDGYTSCTTTNQQVGFENPGCVDTYSQAADTIATMAYIDCMRRNNGDNYPACHYRFDQFNTCSMATSGGTPINADVEISLGDNCGG